MGVYDRAVFTLQQIQERVAQYTPTIFDLAEERRQAAVAIVLREAESGIELLFIKRAEFEGDPWSGHMSFPGGHRDATDRGLREAAERETFEEIGLRLANGEYCGPLSHQRTFGRGNRPGTLVAPFVYITDQDDDFQLSGEVDAVVWGSLEGMVKRNLLTSEDRLINDQPTKFNGYSLGVNRFVWGLTFRTLQEFFKVLDPSYVEPLENH